MAENIKKEDLKKIKLMQRKLSTKLMRVTSQEGSLLDSSLFDSQLKLMDEACDEVTDAIDEMIEDLDESDGDHEETICDLEERKGTVIQTVTESRDEFIAQRNKKIGLTPISKVQEKTEGQDALSDETDTEEESTDVGSLNLTTASTSNKNSAQKLGESIAKKGLKMSIKTSIRDQQIIIDDNSIRKKMEKRIGPSYRILLREIEHGDIEHHQVEAIASRMGGSVKTVYNRKKQTDCDLASIFNLMMDRWYQETIHDPKLDAFDSLIAILRKERRLNYIAMEMEEAQEIAKTMNDLHSETSK